MKIALVGNQNSGKSTLFNALTGSNQKVGNWPGVTIEKMSGVIKNTKFEVVDFPGIYSLNSYTAEEEITKKYIYSGEADVYINVIDCNSISRGLYLTTQLLELNKKIIIVLNMYEIAENKGIYIDETKLSQTLGGVEVIKISAITGKGLERLVDELNIIDKNKVKIHADINVQNDVMNSDFETIAQNRYKYIDEILKNSTIINNNKETVTDKLDKIFLNKIFAIPIFAVIMYFVYYVSIEVIGNCTSELIDNFFNTISMCLESLLTSKNANLQLISLLTDGALKGMSAVISFLPQLFFLFITISFLEKSGYMSRVSLIFDKIFEKIGLSGQSVIPFIIGTGCSVPAIMATRVIKNAKEKKMAAMLTPFIPCSAKLPIISLFSAYFFSDNTGFIAFSFYMLAILVIIFSSLLLKFICKLSVMTSYTAELPEYRKPKFKHIFRDSFARVLDFVKRAGSMIFISSIASWLLLSYSIKINLAKESKNIIELKYESNIEESILASIGKRFSWIFIPMVGENSWELAVSSIQGLIAKEQVVSSMSIISGLEDKNASNNIFVKNQWSPFGFFNKNSAYAYVCFNLFSAPCFGAIGAMKKVLGGNKNVLKAVVFQSGVAYIISCLIFNLSNLIIA